MERTRLVNQVQETSNKPVITREHHAVRPQELYPSGCTLINLGCTDNLRGAFKLGTINTLPGTSQSGKSILAETALACGLYDKRFSDYNFYRDDAEAAYNFDTTYLFGDKVKEEVKEPPLGLSTTVQHFKSNIMLVTKEKPCIYILDTLDALSSDEELEKEMRKALAMAKSEEAAKKIAGSYGMEKAKIMGQVLRMVNDKLKETKSLLIIVQQIRQKTDAMPFSNPYTTSGGEAPLFYSTHQIWLNKAGSLKLKDLKVGTCVRADVKKNKITGKERTGLNFNIWYDYGIDDTRSMIDFLVDQGVWSKTRGILDAPDLGITGTCLADGTGDVMDKIVSSGKLPDLKKLVGQVWKEREESVKLNRIPNKEIWEGEY